jgi:hypothetical protein
MKEVNTQWGGHIRLFAWFICRKLLKELKLNFSFTVAFWSRDSAVGIATGYRLDQCCPTFLYVGAHVTDGCGGAGAVWRLQ